MANVTIQKRQNGGEAAGLARPALRSPFEALKELMRWDPFSELMPSWYERPTEAFVPAFDIKETKDGFEFKADVPGVDPKDIEVKLTNNRLTISGSREAEKADKGDTYYAYERTYGSFSRTFTVPAGVDSDSIQADVKEGVLTVSLPKKPEMKPKKIEVKQK